MLAIIGEHDDNRNALSRMKGVLPGLEVMEIVGVTHGSSVKPSAEALVGFLKRHQQR